MFYDVYIDTIKESLEYYLTSGITMLSYNMLHEGCNTCIGLGQDSSRMNYSALGHERNANESTV